MANHSSLIAGRRLPTSQKSTEKEEGQMSGESKTTKKDAKGARFRRGRSQKREFEMGRNSSLLCCYKGWRTGSFVLSPLISLGRRFWRGERKIRAGQSWRWNSLFAGSAHSLVFWRGWKGFALDWLGWLPSWSRRIILVETRASWLAGIGSQRTRWARRSR